MESQADIAVTTTGDWAVSPTGDLALAAGPAQVGRALITRLLRSPRSLLWAPAYGGGLLDRLERPNSPAERGLMAQLGRANLLQDPRVADARVGVTPVTRQPQRVQVELHVALRTGESASVRREI